METVLSPQIAAKMLYSLGLCEVRPGAEMLWTPLAFTFHTKNIFIVHVNFLKHTNGTARNNTEK